MKSHFSKLFASLFVFFVLAVSAFGQSGASFTVDVPFRFNVGGERLEAGKYELKRVNVNSYLLKSTDGDRQMLIQSPLSADSKESSTRLVFNQYGNKYFLRRIFTNGIGTGRALFESDAEKAIRQSDRIDVARAERMKTVQVAVKVNRN